MATTGSTSGVLTRQIQILNNKSEYAAWKRDILYELKLAGFISSTKSTTIATGKEEEDAIYFILKGISFELKKAIPVNPSTSTLKNFLSYLDMKYANESKLELNKEYESVKMFGIRPDPFLNKLDEVQMKLVNVGSPAPLKFK